jgi:phosphatidylglycerophosphatase A
LTRLIEADPEVRRVALRTLPGFLAFGFGSGLSRFAPGTMGTLAAIPFAVLLKNLPVAGFWILLCFLFVVGVFLCDVSSKRLGQHDPGGIVWDEMVAYWLTVAFIPFSWPWWVLAFVLFRFFDIVKPWPIRRVERRFGGGLGIMLDDIVAALYAMLFLYLAQRFL